MAEALILASASSSRAAMLRNAGIGFVVEAAAIDEARLKRAAIEAGNSASICALALAEAKAREVSRRHPAAVVIGADQILETGGVWFDKPRDLAEAHKQLEALRSRVHRLVTAACAVCGDEMLWHAVSVPELAMRGFSDEFLAGYVAAEGEALLGSVGAYRLEGSGVQLFSRISGDHFAVLGLPLIELLDFLRKHRAIPE